MPFCLNWLAMLSKIWILLGPFYLSIIFLFIASLHPFARKFHLSQIVFGTVFLIALIMSLMSWTTYLSRADKFLKFSERSYEAKLRDEDGLRFEFLRQTTYTKDDKVALIGADAAHDLHFSRFWIYPAEILVGKGEVPKSNKIVILGGAQIEATCGAKLLSAGAGGRAYEVEDHQKIAQKGCEF